MVLNGGVAAALITAMAAAAAGSAPGFRGLRRSAVRIAERGRRHPPPPPPPPPDSAGAAPRRFASKGSRHSDPNAEDRQFRPAIPQITQFCHSALIDSPLVSGQKHARGGTRTSVTFDSIQCVLKLRSPTPAAEYPWQIGLPAAAADLLPHVLSRCRPPVHEVSGGPHHADARGRHSRPARSPRSGSRLTTRAVPLARRAGRPRAGDQRRGGRRCSRWSPEANSRSAFYRLTHG